MLLVPASHPHATPKPALVRAFQNEASVSGRNRTVRSRSTFHSDISGVEVAFLIRRRVSNGNADCDRDACRTFGGLLVQ
jgi:hypothetical protein